MNLACSICQEHLSISMKLPILFPISLPVSSVISSKGTPHTYTQKGECEKIMFAAINPLLHLHNKSRLLSKFHGPYFFTHSIWCFELNLNWRISFPTSTILKFGPILHTDLSVLFRARWFCCLSDKSFPKRDLDDILPEGQCCYGLRFECHPPPPWWVASSAVHPTLLVPFSRTIDWPYPSHKN